MTVEFDSKCKECKHICRECVHWAGPDDGHDHSCALDALLRPARWFCFGGHREDGDT